MTNQKALKFAHQEALKFSKSGGIKVLPRLLDTRKTADALDGPGAAVAVRGL